MFPATVLLLFAFPLILHGSLTGLTVDEDALGSLEDEGECVCYIYTSAASCQCENTTKIEFGLAKMNRHLFLTFECTGGEITDPYKYLPLLFDGRYFIREYSLRRPSLYMDITDCPLPILGLSSLRIRSGNDTESISKPFSRSIISIECGNAREDFVLRKRHFLNLDNVMSLIVNCPALTLLTADLFAGISRHISKLVITNTSVETIPDGFFLRLASLKFLHLTANRLETITSFQGLEGLVILDISRNRILDLPKGMFEYTSGVQTVDVRDNLLSRLPGSICRLKRLFTLNASRNRIQYVPYACFSSIRTLSTLILVENQLRTLDSLRPLGKGSTFRYASVESGENFDNRDVSNDSTDCSQPKMNSTVRIPSNFYNRKGDPHLKMLTVVNLRNNSIDSIAECAFYLFIHVLNVDLSFNTLSNLPALLFSHNLYLRVVLLSHNLFSSIPEGLLSRNPFVKTLDLSSNRIRTLGVNFFVGLRQLKSVDLSNNSIDFLPEDIFLPLNDTARKNDGLVLNLEGNRLTKLPILSLPHLSELNAARNRLAHLTVDALAHVRSLQSINISHNHIKTVDYSPDFRYGHVIQFFHSELPKLSSVDLSNNLLATHPSFDSIVDTLERLDLSGNRIGHFRFPDRPNSLQHLDLSGNRLQQSVEGGLENFTTSLSIRSLRHLDLSWNGIVFKDCPEIAGEIKMARCVRLLEDSPRLEVLIMSHNEMEVIPVFFLALPKLRLVDLRHNKIKRVYHEDLFYVDAVRKSDLVRMGDRESGYFKTGDYFEFPKTRNLTIDLRHNEIAHVELHDEKMRRVSTNCPCELERQFARATMLLGHNPIVCGCQVFNLLLYSLKEFRPVWESEIWEGKRNLLPVTVDVRDLACGSPLTVQGKSVSDLETWAHHLLPLFGLCQLLEHP